MAFLLDTNVVSELRTRNADKNVLTWYEGVQSNQLYLGVVTLGEIRLGIERLRRRDGVQAELLEKWLGRLRVTYRDRIQPLDDEVAEEWGRLNVPDALPILDGLLAATASVRGWTLVTRNVRDIERCGVATLNPFEYTG